MLTFRSESYMEWIKNLEAASQELQRGLVRRFAAGRVTNRNKVLETILKANSFSVSSNESNMIHDAVYTALQYLAHMLGELDRNLTGTFVGVGSYFDGTRVGRAPNEFDYIYELTEISSSLPKAESHGSLEYRFQTNSGSTYTSGKSWLSNIRVRDRLYTLIDQAMKTNSLPAHLHHGGILSPCFSGIRKNGPAFTLLFAWSGGHHVGFPLLISVDITIGIRPHHLQIFADEETKLEKVASAMGVRGTDAHQLYLIAHPDREDAWQMSTAALEVAMMSRLNNKTTRVIKKLKVLKNQFLTLTEEGDIEHQHCYADHKDIAEATRKLQSMTEAADSNRRSEPSGEGKQKIGRRHYPRTAWKEGVGAEDSSVGHDAYGDARVDMKEVVQCVTEIHQCWFQQTKIHADSWMSHNTAERGTLLEIPTCGPMPAVYQNSAKLVHKLCCAYLKNLAGSEGSRRRNLDYLADILPPNLCKAAMEDYKPTVTLKSCVFKYIIIGAILSGEPPPCFTDDGEKTEQNDLQAVIWVLNKLRQSKQLRHPLLEVPIQTYSLAYRGYVVAPRAAASHIEDRLSDILYHFLGTLIHYLDEDETCSQSRQWCLVNACIPQRQTICNNCAIQ